MTNGYQESAHILRKLDLFPILSDRYDTKRKSNLKCPMKKDEEKGGFLVEVGQKKKARRIRLFSGVVRRRPPRFIAILYHTEPKYARASGIAQKIL